MAKKAVIGAGIALDGEKEFKQAISGISKDMTVLSSEMKKVTAEYEDNALSVQALTAKSEVYNKQIDAQKQRIDTLQKALANATTEYGAADSRTKEWTIKLNNAEAGLSKLNSELKSNENNLTVMQGGLDKSGTAITDTTGKTSKYHDMLTKVSDMTGIKIPAGLETFAVGAAATAAAVVAAFKAISAIVTTAQGNIEAAAASMNALSEGAQKAQVDIQQYAALQYAADIIDFNVEALSTGYAKIIKLVADVNDGNESAIATFEKLGISVRDNVTGEYKNADAIFNDVVTSLGKIENQTLRDTLATEIFGKSAKDLYAILNDGGVALSKSMDDAWEKGIVKSQGYYDSLSLVADKTDEINAQINILKSNSAVAWEEMANGSDGFLQNVQNLAAFLWGFVPEPLSKIFFGLGGKIDYDPFKGEAASSNFTSRYQDENKTPNILVDLSDEDKAATESNIQAVNDFAAQNNENLKGVTEKLTNEQQKAADNMSEAIRKAQIDADDSVTEATQKIAKELAEIAQIEKTTAEATEAMNKILNRNSLAVWDPQTQQYVKSGSGTIDWGSKVTQIQGSYASGTDYVPRTGIYQLHEGEKVIPKAQNNGNVYNITIDAKNVQEFNDIVRIAQGARQSLRMGVV